MQVKSIAKCSKGAFCNTFYLYLGTICLFFEWSLKTGFIVHQIHVAQGLLYRTKFKNLPDSSRLHKAFNPFNRSCSSFEKFLIAFKMAATAPFFNILNLLSATERKTKNIYSYHMTSRRGVIYCHAIKLINRKIL